MKKHLALDMKSQEFNHDKEALQTKRGFSFDSTELTKNTPSPIEGIKSVVEKEKLHFH